MNVSDPTKTSGRIGSIVEQAYATGYNTFTRMIRAILFYLPYYMD